MKKKVLYLITKANVGGAQRYVYDLATRLPKDRFGTVVAAGAAGMLSEKLMVAGIPVRHIASLKRDIGILDELSAFSAILRVLKEEKPDVLHLNSSKAGALGALAGRIAGVPKIVFTAHGWPFSEKRNVLWKAFAFVGSWVTALLSHAVICVSESDLALARTMPFVGEKAVRIYNGIEMPLSLGPGDAIRSAFPEGARVTGTVGELNRNKNQIALIEEARIKPDMYVALVGDGEKRAFLEEKIREYGLEGRVKLFGFLPASSVLKGFDTFALPSLKEGLPYVLLEAKAAGLPVEANRVGGVGEILDNDLSVFSLDRMIGETEAIYSK